MSSPNPSPDSQSAVPEPVAPQGGSDHAMRAAAEATCADSGVSPKFNSTVDISPEKWPGKPLDMIADLLSSLTTPSSTPGSLGKIENYDILGIVGQGAMGVVLRAFDESLRRVVAIKLMAPHLISSASAKERFKREARSAAGVSHPNVVTVHAVSEIRGVPFLVMEFIEGQALSQRIHSKPMDSLDVMRIAQQMAAGLAAAHRQGIVHRDIKPSNIMLEDTIERVRIADFGLARVAMEQSNLTSDGQLVGTPSYMSPEQVNGEPLDPRSDLFSVGCVMYAMMTGHSPFEAPNGLAAARAVSHSEPKPLREICHEPHPLLCDLVHQLLQKNPADRIRSAVELESQLSRLIRTWDSKPDTPTVRVNVLSRRKSSPGTKALVAAVLVSGALTFSHLRTWFYPPTPSRDVAGGSVSSASMHQDGVTTTEVPGAVPSDRTTARRPLQVSANGQSGYVRIADALAAAQPDSVIEILDEGPYLGPIVLNDTERLRGVKIVGRQTVITGGADSLIQLSNVPGVTIEGMILNVAGHQHGLEITGDCPGLSVRRSLLQSLTPDKPAIALIHLHHAAGESESPIELRDLDLRFGSVAIVLGDQQEHSEVHHLRIAGCQFSCTAGRTGIPLILFDGLANVDVTRNLFETGQAAVSLSLTTSNAVRGFNFSWNTLRDFDSLLILNDSSLIQEIRLRHNLLLDISQFPVSPANVDQLATWCLGNVWRRSPDQDRELINRVADSREQLSLLGTTVGRADYLVPADPALRAGRSAVPQ